MVKKGKKYFHQTFFLKDTKKKTIKETKAMRYGKYLFVHKTAVASLYFVMFT
jgi:hypothetical protein